MAALRRCLVALAVLAVFAGLASAQNLQPMTCSASATSPTVRAEGLEEVVGDILITCSGGVVANGNSIGNFGQSAITGNFSVKLPANVASRLTNSGATNVVTDALLVIDDPLNNGSFGGFGQGAPLTACSAASNAPKGSLATTAQPPVFAGDAGCAVYVGGTTNGPVASATAGPAAATVGATNAYQGAISSIDPTTVTFFGVPLIPPVSTGINRTYRITNLRIAGTGLSGAQNATVTVTASTGQPTTFLFSGTTASPSVSPALQIATVTQGVTAAVTGSTTGGTTLLVCTPGTLQPAGQVSFSSLVGSGFRTRFATAAGGATQYSLQGAGGTTQTTPGGAYTLAESGLNVTLAGAYNNQNLTAGLADFGTRLTVKFAGVPKGVSVYVSFTNVNSSGQQGLTDPANAGKVGVGAGFPGSNNLALMLAQTNTEVTGDGSPFATPFATPTTVGGGAWAPSVDVTGNGFQYVPVTISQVGATAGTGTATWEVVDTGGAATTLYFNIYTTYTVGSGSGQISQTNAGTAITVTPSIGPAATTTNTSSVPRFTASTTSGTAATFTTCQTSLLFPYIQTSGLFETGVAISNTSQDPFGTSTQAGACTLNFYGTNAPAVSSVTIPKSGDPYVTTYPGATTITAGTTWANVSSAYAPGFTGYMIAVCNFQMAHGFAFIAYNGNTNEAMGYLPLVLQTSGGRITSSRAVESLTH